MPPEYSQFNTGALFADDPTVRTDQPFPHSVQSGSAQKPIRFTRANFADPATYTPVSGFLRSRDIMELDPDPTGERTEAWGAKNGEHLPRSYVAGLNVFGRIMDRDKLVASEAGRQLLSIAEKNRAGDRRGFWDALTDFGSSDLPFVGMVASVGGSVSDAVSVFDTLKALQDGMPVSDENLIKTRLYLAKQDYDASGSWGSTVGGIVRAAPGFMIEFAASGGLAAAGRAAAVDAGVGGTHLAMSRGAKVLARESVEHEAEKIVAQAVGKTAGRAAVAEGFAGLAGTASEREVVEATAKRLFGFMKSTDAAHLYKGFSDDALMSMAKNRAQYEFGKMLSRRGGTALSNGFHSFTQWLGQNVSRGLLDFGAYGTEEATTLFTRQSTAGRALADALGVFAIEAPIKGGVLMLPKKAVEQGVVAPAFGQDGRIVSDNALSLRATALMTGNRSLMDSAESIALGMDLLEYISENTGRGLKSLLAAGGIGLERLGVRGLVRPAATAISAAGRELPSEGLEAVTVGGKMRQFVQKVFGSRAGYARRIAGQEAELVANRLGVEGAERAAVRSAVMTGNITGLRPELQQAIGSDLGKFVKETVSQAYDQGVKDLQYKSYARYAMAKWMQKHQVGPETVMNMFNQMGYDGVLGEMFEERYSDVVKGLLGLDARTDTVTFVPGAESSETASFLNNVKEAVKGLYPGWDQLTAEAVGFMFPMVTRGVAMRAMSAIGGQGELVELRSKLDVIDDAMRHNTVGEMTYADAQTAFEYARQADAKEVAGLRERLAEFEEAGDVEQAKAVRKELETREAVAARRVERQKVFFDSVDEAAKNVADALIAVPLDTYGTLSDATLTDRSPVLTAAEARQVLDAQKALGDFASQLARQIVEGQLPVEGESEGAFRKIARKLVGVAGFLATGDFSLAAVNPAQWTARDMGLSKNVVDSLRDGFRAELQRVRESSPDTATSKEMLDEAQRRFDHRARQIMSANLAVHQLRSFTDGRLTEEAAAQWAASTVDADGRTWHYSVDENGRGEFYKLAADGSGVDAATVTSLDQMLREHKADIEGVKRDIIKATVDIMTRRMTGADHGRNSVLAAMTLDRGSDLLDIAIYDAAMHMIGAQDLIYRVSLDGRTPLKAVLESRSVARVSDGVVDYIASKPKLDEVDARALESVAQALRLRFDGTEGGLKARNEKIFRMAKLMRLNRREGSLFFSREILGEDEEALRMSANGTSTLVAKRQSDGTYTVDFGARRDRPAERDIRTFGSVDELVRAMSAEGYTQDEAHTVLTQAKVIESSDMFWMIRELGLAKEYFDRLGDRANDRLHPMLRRDGKGKLLSQDEAEKLLREELAAAHRGVDAAAGTTDRKAYDRLFGEDGYMAVGEKLLADHGIRKDTLQPYVGEFHDYAPSRYTYLMSAGRISPKSADTYVVIDPNIDSDITSGLVNAVLLHAYGGHGGLLRDTLGNVISDFVKDVRRAAKDALADAEAKKDADLAAQLRTFLRTCCDDVDRVVRMNNGEMKVRRGIGLTPVGFTTLANAFGLFRAREDATNPMLRALATIAPQVWGSPSFLAFENVLNATLGGNFLDTAIWSAKPGAKDYVDPSLTGIPQVMALASADANALRNAVQSSLPAGLGYEQFLDAVLQQLTVQSKTASPAITEDEQHELRAKARAATAANADAASHFTFLGGLVSTLKAAIDRKVTTSATVTDFLASVLAAVEHDPNTTERQRTAAARQLDYLRKRNEADTSEQAYLKKVEELSEVQKKLVAAQDEVKALRQRLVEMDQAALAGSAVPEAERQNAQTELADATAELEDFMSELAKKQEEMSGVPAPEGVKALQVGGDTREDKVAQAAVEIEDFGDATVANDPLGQDVPEVFAREASRREDGFLVEWGRATDDLNQRLTRQQAKLASSVVIQSLGSEVDEDSFVERVGKMFPHMSEAERADVVQAFRGLDAERLAAGLAWDQVVISGSHFGFVEDDLSDEDTSSDNFNERALAEYNSESVKDFAALAKRVASETNGSVMGFVELLREQAVRRPTGTEANDLLRVLLCPQLVPGLQSLAQADAHHKRALDRFDFGVDREIAQAMEMDPRAAFLLSYLSSLPVNARTRFAGLCAGSVAATPVHVTDGVMSAVGSAPDGKIPDALVVDSVDALVGMTARRLGKLADSLVSKAKGLALSSEGSVLDQLKHNAAAVAELFAEVFGRNNPLYTALTSGIAHAAWARAGEPVQKALLAAVSRSSRGVDAVNTIASAMKELASRGQDATRQDVESMFIAAFTMGGFSNPGLIRTPSRITHTDPLLGFLNMFQAALPRTMMKSEIDQSREQTRGSVVVAPRGMVPLLSRWLYQEGEGSFTDICRRTWKGISDEVLAECRQNGTWPDDARTLVCAKCLSSSLTPREVYRACRDAYDTNPNATAWVPIYSGDHSSFTVLQVPPAVRFDAKDYKSFAKAAYKAIGMDLMFTDTKRSAISSLEAQGTGLVGVDAQGRYGEHRVHILHSWQPGTKNESFLGSTFMAGYGVKKIGAMSADPESNTKKVHVVGGAGRDLFFIKSLTISQEGLNGKFREGSAPRAVFDYIEKFRGSDSLSTDTVTDNDSYKIGPGNSKGLRVVNNGDSTVMDYVFDRLVRRLYEQGILHEGDDQDTMAKTFKAAYDKLTGDELDEAVGPLTVKDNARGTTAEMKLSEIMPGAMVNAFEGWSGPALDLSYREDSAMAYTVANVAHNSRVPAEPGRSPRNYEIDALAMVRTLAEGGWLKTPQLANQFHELMANWGVLSSAVYAHPQFRKALIRMDENLAELRRSGEFISSDGRFSGQFAVEEITRQMMAKVRQAANLPMRGIDAPLVAAGASIGKDGSLVAHTTSRMEAAMLKGSELFSDEERAFYGTDRRLALCNVNVSNNGFRYGWFLADDAEAKNPEAYRNVRVGLIGGRRHADAIRWAAEQVRRTTSDLAAADESNRDELRKNAADARLAFASMFVDHHGVSVAKYGDRYLRTFGVEDLFIPTRDGADAFDYSAVQCEGRDLVFNDVTGKEHVFLGGTAFGLPRTPSYNGAPWLQVVRAGLPVTEQEIPAPAGERDWLPGEDAMVSPDPYTNEILGCDHDGDKTKLYMYGVDGMGGSRFMVPPSVEDGVSFLGEDGEARRDDYLAVCAGRGFLERVRVDDRGNEVSVGLDDVSPDAYYRISNNVRKLVSNSYVRFLFSMARQLPVDMDAQGRAVDPRECPGANDGKPRRRFFGHIGSPTTSAFPGGKSGEKQLLPKGRPSVIEDDGSKGTLGDPELAMEIATSAEDAGDARGVMVSLARTLHMAWATGLYSGHFQKESELASLLGPMTGTDWLKFMHLVDGLSNATFDDIKKQVCGRLGWTKGMMDCVLTELLLWARQVPTTEADFLRVLQTYATSISKGGSRYWMLRNSSMDDADAHRTVVGSLLSDAEKRMTKSSLMSVWGHVEVPLDEGGGTKLAFDDAVEHRTIGNVFGGVLLRECPMQAKPFLSFAVRDSGYNPAAALAYWALVRALNDAGMQDRLSVDDVDGKKVYSFRSNDPLSAEDAERLGQSVDKALRELKVDQWTKRRGLLLDARAVASSVTYLTADPGAPGAQSAKARAAEAFAKVKDSLGAGPAGAIPESALVRMHEATMLMYDVGEDLYTSMSRAVAASENRDDLVKHAIMLKSGKALEAAGRLLAKDRVYSRDLMRLQANQQQVPVLAEFFTGAADDVLGQVGMSGVSTYEMLKRFASNIAGDNSTARSIAAKMREAQVKAIREKRSAASDLAATRAGFTPPALAARAAVESMLAIMYELMVTSTEFAGNTENRAAGFLRMANDGAFQRRQAEYGAIAVEMRRVMPMFRANDQMSLDKVRDMFDRVILGRAFTGERVLAGPNARYTKAGSFTLSRATLLAYVRELTGGKSSPTTLDGIMRLAISDEAKNNVRRVWQALGDDSTTVTPAVLFGALLPAYTLMTSRMTGVPNASSISLMTCLPSRYYSALSSGEAHRRGSGDPIVPLMVGSDWAVNMFNPKKLDLLVQEQDPEGYELSEEYADVLESRRNELRGGAGLTESRRNPSGSNVVDIFDPAFETALGALREGSSGAVRLPQATSVNRLSNGGYDQNAAKLALAMGALLGSWAKVEYNGGTAFTIRGSLRGDAGSGKAVSIIVDTSANPLLDSEEDVERLADSSAYAASLTATVDLGMTAEDFLVLPKEVRKALVRRFGVGGVASSKVSWTVSAKGLTTLVGKVSVPAGGTAVYHEYFHSMMRMFESFGFFGQEDYAQLRETFGEDPSGRHKFNEEKAAEAFRKWVEGNTDSKAAAARGVFQRILDFLKGLLETLKQGFGFGGDEGADTLFRMMVHGIAQPSSARLAEEKLEQAATASEVRRRFTLPAAGHRAARSALEQAAGQEAVSVAVSVVSELEELPNAALVDEATLKRSDRLTGKVSAVLSNPDASVDQIVLPLQRLAAVRREMARTLGVEVDAPAAVETPDLTVNAPADPVAENVAKVVSPLVNNNLFYRTANSIRESLEHGLRESGAWTDDLEYVVSRYSANDAQSEVDENLRRQSILHGLRRAMLQVNPAAAKSLSDKEVEGSLAYRAALVMHQHLGESFLNNRPAGRSPAVREAARHASQYNVAAWIMSTKPQAPAELVSSARTRIEELYNASPSGASKAELRMHLDQIDKLDELVGDHTKLAQWRRDQGMSTMNDVIGSLRAGTVDGGLDEHGNPRDLAPIAPVDAAGNPTTLNPKSEEHLKTFQASHQDPAVQESLKLALTTAYQLAAMAKYYGELDVHPALAGDIAEAKRLARLNGIPEHMSSLEFLGEHLVGDSNLVDNPAYVDYQCQSHFIGQNVDAWLRSMVRGSFGAREGLGRMMSDEHFEYAGLVNEITLKENWIAHMLGVSLEPGGELLKVIRQKGEYRMENGEVVRKMGDEYIRFDNYGRKSTSVRMTEDDIRRVDFWLKMCSAHANRQIQMVTGVDGVSFYRQLSRKAKDYSIDAVTAKRSRNERMNPVEWAVWRMTRQIPADLLPSVHRRFVDEALAAMARADHVMNEGTPYGPGRDPMVYDAATYSSYVVGELVRRGVLVGYNPGESRHKGGLPRYENAAVVISCDVVDAMFHNSETVSKLLEAGRDAKWLDRDFICREFMSVWEDTARFVKRHPWLTHGDGQYFHAFGTALPFWRGSGIFMYNAVRTDRQNRITLSDKMSAAEQLVDKVMKSLDGDRPLAGMKPGDIMDDVDTLARFVGAPHRAAQFLEDVLAGKYEAGERDSLNTGLVLSSDATYGDLARAIYERARQLVWASRTGYAGSRHLEAENIIARYEETRLTRGEVFGGSVGFKDTDMFRMHGTLPANYEIGHKVHKCIDGITNAMMSRATLANLLLTPEGSTGAPVYYADPNKLAAEASGLPDAFWGNLADWWQAHNSDIGQVYDPAKSGVENAKTVYEAVRAKFQIKGKPRKAQIGELGYTELGGDDSQLVSVDRWLVLDGNGEDFLNATAGGEAMGYLKHFLDAGKTLGFGGAQARAAIQRALSYSKSLSVSFSFFFPIATKWESPIGAVGAMATIGSNWKMVGAWMKEHPDAANKIRGMFGGKAWITHDFIGLTDIVRMMDSNDPFLAEMYSWAAALGIPVSTSVTNPMEPDKTVLLKDIRRMKEAVRSSMGAEVAGKFSRMMDAILVRQGDKAFNYVLNATKLAVVAQMCMKLRHQANATGKAFDPVRDLKKYSRYINAEVGGIDPMQFAWAHPKAQSLMNMALFSWQWTVGAWQAGGGSVVTELLTGGHTMTPKERAYFVGRWMRMYLGVMIGVPALFQVIVLAIAKAMGGGDDDDHWGTWQNEDKARWTAFDLTPLLKAIARFDETKLGGVLRRYKENGRGGSILAGVAAGAAMGGLGVGGIFNTRIGSLLTGSMGGLIGAGVGAIAPSLVPLYTGNDAANKTTHRRRYYMHFGKQGWEFFRWFDDAKSQFFSKLSMPVQRIAEGVMGRSLSYLERSLPWEEQGQFERWLSPTTDSALFNVAEAFLPFSVSGMNRNGDAGVLPIFGPVQMGASQTATQKRLVAALEKWAANDSSGYRYGRMAAGKRAGKPYQLVADVLQDAERNGLDPQDQLNKACGQVMRGYYGKLFDALPERPNDDYDVREVSRILRALNRLGSKKANALNALKDRYKTSGHEWKTLPPEQRQRVRDILSEGFVNPFDY